MTFLYPLGLLGLIGVPIIIVIYLIKSKYAEQTVSSTYLWELSERFMNKKKRRPPLVSLISLILQLLTVILVSLAIAHPIITVPGSAREYTFILDASGSMNISDGETTRFERGKVRIAELIGASADGSIYTLVQVGSVTTTAFEGIDNKELALELLENVKPGYDVYDKTDALGIAQERFTENPGTLTYLVTDTEYGECENITLINTSLTEVNYSLTDVEYSFTESGLSLGANVALFGKDSGTVTVSASADGGDDVKVSVNVASGEKTAVSLLIPGIKAFDNVAVSLDTEDAMSLDNTCILYDTKSNSVYNILLVSDRPFFIETAILNLGYRNITVLSPKEYTNQTGYGLYIFDSMSPTAAPTDGTVWLINPDGKLDNTGFGVRDYVKIDEDGGGELELTKSSSTVAKSLARDISGKGVYLSEYTRCGLYRNFTTVLSYQGNPVLFAGTNTSGSREVVFAFDLHNSNLALHTDYLPLMRNLLEFSFPDILDSVSYTVGDEAVVNIPARCESVRVDTPLGNVYYLSLNSASESFTVTEVGTYKITIDAKSTLFLYSSLPEEESQTKPIADTMSLQGEASDIGHDGRFDTLIVVFILLALVFSADWMVYCYEKYQLR